MKDNQTIEDSNDDFMYSVYKIIANPLELTVYDHPNWIRPNIGDHVEIVSWDTQCNVQESVKLSKLPYLTVKEVIPYVVGCGDSYYWAYQIEVEESQLEFLQWHYRVLS
jgi:hypothetical protein